jgi:hypothetical protein
VAPQGVRVRIPPWALENEEGTRPTAGSLFRVRRGAEPAYLAGAAGVAGAAGAGAMGGAAGAGADCSWPAWLSSTDLAVDEL